MAVSLVGVGALTSGTATPMTVALPAGVQQNDLILIFAVVDSTGATSGTITATGYTELTSELQAGPVPDTFLAVLYKIAGASEASPSLAASSGASNGFFAFSAAYRGVDGTTPFDTVTPVDTASGGTTVTFTPAGITTVTANAFAVSIVAMHTVAGGVTLSAAQSFTDPPHASGTSYQTTTGSDVGFGFTSREVATPAAVTMPTWTNGNSTGVQWVGSSFALRPSGGAGSPITVTPSSIAAVTVSEEFGAEVSASATPAVIAVAASVPSPDVTTPPTVVSNNLWRRDSGDTGDGIRVAVDVAPNGTFIDWAVASSKDYEYRAEAIGNNGTVTFGDWT
jgi:hypothetical protein